jgi:HD-GYP domain-containing protein (c-di-GMP phosphodiesterase class II)
MIDELKRQIAVPLAAAAVVIAAAFGIVAWYVEVEILEDALSDLATAEATNFVQANRDVLVAVPLDHHRLSEHLNTFLAERHLTAEGHFIAAEIYNAAHSSLATASRPEAEGAERAFDRSRHTFPAAGSVHYDKVRIKSQLFVRVLVDVSPHGFDGTFEGIYQVSPERLNTIRQRVLDIVLLVIAVVAGTTAFLLPVMIGLNRRLVRLSRDLLHANVDVLDVLGQAIAKRDSDTGQHNYRVTIYAIRLAEAAGVDRRGMKALIKGAFLHDVGKIAIRDDILLKPGKLTKDEFEVMKTHVAHGRDIVARSRWLADAVEVVGGHHEKYDGSGYPEGLAGEDIPLGARIFALADVFDALTSRRPYKDPLDLVSTLRIIAEGRGAHFDPQLLDRFAEIVPQLYERLAGMDEDALRGELHATTTLYYGDPATAA